MLIVVTLVVLGPLVGGPVTRGVVFLVVVAGGSKMNVVVVRVEVVVTGEVDGTVVAARLVSLVGVQMSSEDVPLFCGDPSVQEFADVCG